MILSELYDVNSSVFDIWYCIKISKLNSKIYHCYFSCRGHINIISCCDISHDERKFATGSWDKTVNIWDIATGSYR